MPGKPLEDKKLEEMFRVFCDTETIGSVSVQCGVAEPTVRKYRVSENWDKRLADIKNRAHKKADTQISTQKAKWIQSFSAILHTGLNELIEKIQDKDPLKLSVSDLDRIVRLLAFIDGQPDSRPDVPGSTNINILGIDDSNRDKYKSIYAECVTELERRRAGNNKNRLVK